MIKLVLLLFLIQFSNVFAEFRFNHISVTDGLPTMIVREIHQDSEGYMWFGTSLGLVRYDGYEIEAIKDEKGNNFGDVWSIVNGTDGSVLFAVVKKGIFKYQNRKIKKIISLDDLDGIEYKKLIFDSNGLLWIGTNLGIFQYDQTDVKKIISWSNQNFYSFVEMDEHMFAQSEHDIYKISKSTNSAKQLKSNLPEDKRNNILYKDNQNLYLGREDGLFIYDINCSCFKPYINELINHRVYSLISDHEYLWIGTLYDGLYRYNKKTSTMLNITNDNTNGLSDVSVLSLYIDDSNVLWIGTFHGGVIYINRNNFEFNIINDKVSQYSCIESNVINDILEAADNSLWLATENGLINTFENKCKILKFSENNKNSLTSNKTSSVSTSDGDIWITSTQGGFDHINQDTNKINRLGEKYTHINFYFTVKYKQGMILGSFENGLFYYNNKKQLKKMAYINDTLSNSSFYSYTTDNDNNLYFTTSRGVAKLNTDNQVELIDIGNKNNGKFRVTSIDFDNSGNLWVGNNYQQLLKIDPAGSIIDLTKNLSSRFINVTNIVATDDDFVWITTSSDLFKINIKTNESWKFSSSDGLPQNEFLMHSSYKGQSGNIYFGGRNGAISFDPQEISINKKPPKIVLTSLNYFNKKLNSGDVVKSGFNLENPINNTSEIELGYKDYIIGFEFAALDYADSMRNQYAYRLKGLYDDWVYVDANDRKATFTNLSPGDYTFQVKASNKDGVWSEAPKELKIKVYPAPWFSPWAYFSYLIIIIFSIWAFIRYKTIASRKRAQKLEITVEERTHEVNLQKKMVETLLDHKNEVFANITHEFKTPLALILGPADQLADESELLKHSDKLNMIQRNAKRLMLMVGQILKLSQAELDKEVIRESQAVQPTLTMLYESFKPLAQNKDIDIVINNDIKTNVYATAECLEIVIGNLLSNALKFTNFGGKVYVASELNNNQVSISIRDTGTGIDKKDLKKVFKRFVRLDTHKSIQGTGIGLSVVKEITEANDGQVVVNSELGKGSEFIVTFPVSDIDADEEMSQVMVDQLVSNTENEISYVQPKLVIDNMSKNKKNRITVLIIEDNLDMQAHIGNVLKSRFNCLFSDRGRSGIAIALKEVPDVIICDVMMPEMDGYQVTRILRHDGRTSHIPIILLTALNTKESRIKGWRENIDIYVTKPFDATELNVQLDNILTIRKMLQQKTNKAIRTNDSLNTLNLSQQDLKFINKFQDVISKYYTNEYFQKADLASKMAVSERQLQRKIKALIDESPMDMLRDYRLEKATMKLKNGYQVGLVSDECGFSSVSYFGSCFKKKYGVTPKKYQQLK